MDDYYYQAKAYHTQLLCDVEKIRLLRAIRVSRKLYPTSSRGSTKLGVFFHNLFVNKLNPRPVVVHACEGPAFCPSGTVSC
jgi:hypothetical protein